MSAPPIDRASLLELVTRFPRPAALALGMSGCIVLASAVTVVALLHLPAVALTAPWALALSLLSVAVLLARHSPGRQGTAGIDADTERRILDVAVVCNGRVTTTGIAHALGLPLAHADAALTALAAAGYVAIETHPVSGALLYVFPDVEAGLVPPNLVESVRSADALRRASGNETGQSLAPVVAAPVPPSLAVVRVANRSRIAAALLAICGGSFGAHEFYLGKPISGFARLAVFWTLVPAFAGLCEGFCFLLMSDLTFDRRYNARIV